MWKKLPLHSKIIISLILGIVWSLISSALGWNEFTTKFINPFGVIFIKLLKFIAIPLILFSITSGISSLPDISKLGRMGFKTLGMYLVTTVLSISVGLFLVNTVKPGSYLDKNKLIENRINYELWANENHIPIQDGKNLLKKQGSSNVTVQKVDEATQKKIAAKIKLAQKREDAGPLQFLVDIVPDNLMKSLGNNVAMLQVIFFAIFFGICLSMLKQKAQPVVKILNSLNEIFLKMVDIIMKAAPFFVFCLLAGVISKMANTPAEVWEIFKGLGIYSITVLVGLIIMVFVVYPFIVISINRKMTYHEFFRNASPAQFLAFSTSSSAATLPVTMECVEDNFKINNRISSFVLPIGATVNMDGTSLYQAVAVIFLAQIHMIDLNFVQQLTIILTATMASIGSAAVPGAGLVMLIIVLQTVGLNPAWIAVIFPVDRILDMCRTSVNVTGDITVCSAINKMEKID